MNKSVLIVAAVVIAIVGLFAWLLSSGRTTVTARRNDPKSDVIIGKGSNRPRNVQIADIRNVTVRNEDGIVTLEAVMGKPLALRLPQESGVWRWEIYEDGTMTWIVSATVDVGPNASIIATQKDFSATTINDSLPGDVKIAGNKITVTLESGELKGFPQRFETVLKTTLDANRSKASSAVAEDRAPDGGELSVGG